MNIVIVGASSSVGVAMVKKFSEANHRVLATGRHLPSVDIDKQVKWVKLDLTDSATFPSFVSAEVALVSPVDVAIFAAGILPGLSLDKYEDEQIDQVMDINFSSQARLIKALLPVMKFGSQIIMMSSISAERGSYDPIYAASKAAIIGFVKSLAVWLAPGVRTNALAPALLDASTMFEEMKPEVRERHLQRTPTQRLTTVDELAAMSVLMCDPAWGNVNGQVIRVNGGAYV